MLKKLLIASAVLATSSTVAFAAASGPYLGLGVGVQDVATQLKDDDATVNKFNGRSAVLDMFGGYGAVVNQNIYLGGELFVNIASAQSKVTSVNDGITATSSITAKNSYGLSFIPGLMVSEHTMVFARLGVVRTAFNVKTTDADDSAGSQSSNKNKTGAQFGLGLQTSLAQNVDLRGEYVYTNYSSINIGGTKYTPSTDQVNLALIYKFD